jgi:metal-responsive CopG/Arc/MetJ family transcriptional regulator
MQATISLKIPQDLVTRLKKASRIRGLSMSDLIRQNLQNTYASDTLKNKEPEIFKYFGLIQDDAELQQFDKDLEKRKKGYKGKVVEF